MMENSMFGEVRENGLHVMTSGFHLAEVNNEQHAYICLFRISQKQRLNSY
jgi:hypothetical protein